MQTDVVVIGGGKLTTCRMMAGKTSHAVCVKLGVDESCATPTTETVRTA